MSPKAFQLGLFLALLSPASASDSTLPSAGFGGDRYATLWTKSPFAIATPETAAASQDYQLVGLAQFDGVSYASLINQQTQEHFTLTSNKPANNLTLVSVQHDAKGSSAVIEKNGEQLVLHEDNAAPVLSSANPINPTIPGFGSGFPSQANPSVGGVAAPVFFPPPRVRIHRPLIVVTPRPVNAN